MKTSEFKSINLINTLIIVLTITLFFSCDKDADQLIVEKGSVQFSMDLANQNALKSAPQLWASPVNSLLVSLEKTSGTKIFTLKKIPLIQFGEEFITDPISLETGDYIIKDFLVVDKDGVVVYATPKEGSANEGSVEDPLPINFVVKSNKVQNVSPQVLVAVNATPKDFGYETFSFDIVETYEFLIGVFTNNDKNKAVSLLGSTLTVSAGSDILYSGTLNSVTNLLVIPSNKAEYKVTVSMSGYTTYEQTFTKKEFKMYIKPDGTPLVVILKKGEKALIFWNKLGSIDEIMNSEVGPGIQLTSYKVQDWEQAQIVPAVFGNGLFVNHDINEGWINDGGNFFAIDNRAIGLTAERGCIEFWFIFKYDCSAFNNAYFLRSADSLAGHWDIAPLENKIRMYLGWNGWDYGSYGKRYLFLLYNGSHNWENRLHTADYSAAPGGYLAFSVDQTVHFGFAWDMDGIDGTNETMRIYVNGVKEAFSTAPILQDDGLMNYSYIGSTPNYGPDWDHNYNAVKGVTDNLKIWNYAKTNFSDRFVE